MSCPLQRRCLICSSSVISEESYQNPPQGSCPSSSTNSILDRQLMTVYLISKLLQVPDELCTRFLTHYGHPAEWVGICGWCGDLVAEGRAIFDAISSLERKHAKVRSLVRERMKIQVKEEDNEVLLERDATQEIQRYLDGLDNLEEDATFASEALDVGKFEGFGILESNTENNKVLLGRKDGNKSKRRNRESKLTTHKKRKLIDSSPSTLSTHQSPLPRKSSRSRNVKQIVDDAATDELIQDEEDEHVVVNYYDDGSGSDMDFHYDVDDDASADSDTNNSNDDEDEDNVIDDDKDNDSIPESTAPQTNSKQSRKKSESKTYNANNAKSSDTNKPRRVRPDRRKDRRKEPKKKEILTLEQVIERRNKFLETLPPYSKTMSEEDAERRNSGLASNNLGTLCKKYLVKEFLCKTCKQVFTSYKDWYNHTRTETCGNELLTKYGPVVIFERIKCEECGKPVGNSIVLEDHIRTAHCPKEMLKCRGCSVIYIKANDYVQHFHNMVKSNPSSDCVKFGLKCPQQCRTAYRNNQETLDLHVKIRHFAPPPRTYKCIQCNKSYASKPCLTKHLSTHGTADFKCNRPNCSSAFRSHPKLQYHIRDVHLSKEEGAPKFTCETCGKTFYTMHILGRHKKIHNDESPHLCTICGKTYKVANYLTIHMWTHEPKLYKSKYGMYRENAKKRRQQQQEEAAENADNCTNNELNEEEMVNEDEEQQQSNSTTPAAGDWPFL